LLQQCSSACIDYALVTLVPGGMLGGSCHIYFQMIYAVSVVIALKLPVDMWQWKFVSLHQWTPLHVAAYKDHVDAVTFLVDNGADVNIKDEHEVSEW